MVYLKVNKNPNVVCLAFMSEMTINKEFRELSIV